VVEPVAAKARGMLDRLEASDAAFSRVLVEQTSVEGHGARGFRVGTSFNNNSSRRQCDPQGDRDPQRQQYTPTREVDRNALSQSVGTEVDVRMRDPKRHVSPR